MTGKKEFDYKKSQIENYLKSEFQKKFRTSAKISVRKRQKFIDDMTRKVGKKFGKDVLFLVDFSKRGFTTIVSPAHTQSTDKGKLFQSFSHPQVFYTSHCMDRFSERTDTTENCIIALDTFMDDALLSFGENEGHMSCPEGVFAYVIEKDRLVIKTFILFEMLSDEQIKKFYGPGMISTFPKEFFAGEGDESDFLLGEELSSPNHKP